MANINQQSGILVEGSVIVISPFTHTRLLPLGLHPAMLAVLTNTADPSSRVLLSLSHLCAAWKSHKWALTLAPKHLSQSSSSTPSSKSEKSRIRVQPTLEMTTSRRPPDAAVASSTSRITSVRLQRSAWMAWKTGGGSVVSVTLRDSRVSLSSFTNAAALSALLE